MILPHGVTVVYGDALHDNYCIIKDVDLGDNLYVVHSDFFGQEAAVIFEVVPHVSDWSEGMLLKTAKAVVDFLNAGDGFYPRSTL